MNKNILQLIAGLFLCACVTSCQKELIATPDPVPPPVITLHDSVTRLSQLIFIDTYVSATDTTGYYEYLYDNLQRVTTINIYDYYNSPSIPTVFTFYYSGSDSLSYKMTEEGTHSSDTYSYTTFYFYDNLQRLIKDSAIYGPDVYVYKYNYSNTMITTRGSFVYNNDLANPYLEADTGFIGSTGDVIKTNSLTLNNEDYVNNFTYDDKPNPFSQLNIHTTYNPMPGFNFYLYDFLLQKNNTILATEENQLYPGTITTTTYSYTYNALGVPETVNISDQDGPTSEPRILFLYKKI